MSSNKNKPISIRIRNTFMNDPNKMKAWHYWVYYDFNTIKWKHIYTNKNWKTVSYWKVKDDEPWHGDEGFRTVRCNGAHNILLVLERCGLRGVWWRWHVFVTEIPKILVKLFVGIPEVASGHCSLHLVWAMGLSCVSDHIFFKKIIFILINCWV